MRPTPQPDRGGGPDQPRESERVLGRDAALGGLDAHGDAGLGVAVDRGAREEPGRTLLEGEFDVGPVARAARDVRNLGGAGVGALTRHGEPPPACGWGAGGRYDCLSTGVRDMGGGKRLSPSERRAAPREGNG